jgi:hypothetical protein
MRMPRALTSKGIIRKAAVEVIESETAKPYLKLKAANLLLNLEKLRTLASARKAQNARRVKNMTKVVKKGQISISSILDGIYAAERSAF